MAGVTGTCGTTVSETEAFGSTFNADPFPLDVAFLTGALGAVELDFFCVEAFGATVLAVAALVVAVLLVVGFSVAALVAATLVADLGMGLALGVALGLTLGAADLASLLEGLGVGFDADLVAEGFADNPAITLLF